MGLRTDPDQRVRPLGSSHISQRSELRSALLNVQCEQVQKPCKQEESKAGRGSRERVKVKRAMGHVCTMLKRC